ncbi:Aste57867_19675 [Aphanomyces stellatus]|uniref:Aste57867_19675 protein n=1 Tax=Aphanomyces stellatus TaxID=120398 RepID=A0A485LD54_9STRA|nr:hypothetical protein As57867_019610 [Aphanomyces stellatus]VFT96375.1 Aste57867_19675 [Aphanomyces stellatus]
MPLDASFPAARLSYMLMDAEAKVIITTEDYRGRMEEMNLPIPTLYIRMSELAANPKSMAPSSTSHPVATRDDEAYVVYTSGSTGKPKGVPVLHKGVVNLLFHSATEARIVAGTRVMQFMSLEFDGCQWELWKSLSNGATLVFRPQTDVMAVLATVDVLMITPTGLSLLGHPSSFSDCGRTHDHSHWAVVVGTPLKF